MKSKQSKKVKASFKLKAIYDSGSQCNKEPFDLMFGIYATWVDRAVRRQIGINGNASQSAEDSERTALTSLTNNRTVGMLNNCKTGDSIS